MRLLTEPFHSGFMQRALIEAVLLGIVGGVIGVHVVLRRLAFMADALTHTVFPGMAVAFLLSGSLYVGALVTGVASAGAAHDPHPQPAHHVRRGAGHPADRLLLGRRDPRVAQPLVHRRPHRAAVRPGARRRRGARSRPPPPPAPFVLVGAVAAAQGARPAGRSTPRRPPPLGYPIGALDLVLNILITLVVVSAVKAVGSVLVIALAGHAGGDGPAARPAPRRRDDGRRRRGRRARRMARAGRQLRGLGPPRVAARVRSHDRAGADRAVPRGAGRRRGRPPTGRAPRPTTGSRRSGTCTSIRTSR